MAAVGDRPEHLHVGPSVPSVKVSTNTVWRAARVSMVATAHAPPATGIKRATSSPRMQLLLALGVRAGDHRQHGAQGGLERRLLAAERGEQVVHAGALGEVDRQQRRLREAAQTGPETDADAHEPNPTP